MRRRLGFRYSVGVCVFLSLIHVACIPDFGLLPVVDGDSRFIAGHVEAIQFEPFLSGRRCWVYLPRGYLESSDTYPVLYMHDGQHLFQPTLAVPREWQVDETLEMLISNREIEPVIVVGIENAWEGRCHEYMPWHNTDPRIPCVGGGGGADDYLQAIRDVLMPEINRRYRTRSGPENTYMAGSSLGGLISIYAAYEYDGVWGRIGAVSPYFPCSNRRMFEYAAGRSRPLSLTHFYQDMGTLEFGFTDADASGTDDFVEDLRRMRDLAIGQGFVEGVDLVTVECQGHTHTESDWARRMPALLRFLLDAPAEPIVR